MLQGFEHETKPLTDYERDTLLPLIVYGLRAKVGAAKVIAGSTIVEKMRAQGYKLSGTRLRKIVNHIRTRDLIPGLVSTGNGYYVATSAHEIDDCITSLQGRVDAIKAIINALERQRLRYN